MTSPSNSRWALLLISLLIYPFSTPLDVQDEPSSELVASITWPSDSDFVTVMQGGEQASILRMKLADSFSVPQSGYISIVLGSLVGEVEEETFMCPRAADSIESCPNEGKHLSGDIVVSLFGLQLGAQEVSVRAYSTSGALLSTHSSTIVTSTTFPGRHQSVGHFASQLEAFVSPLALPQLWERIHMHLAPVASTGDANTGTEDIARKVACSLVYVGGSGEDLLLKYSLPLPRGVDECLSMSFVHSSTMTSCLGTIGDQVLVHTAGKAIKAGELATWLPEAGIDVLVINGQHSTNLTETVSLALAHLSRANSPPPRAILLGLDASSPRQGLSNYVAHLWRSGWLTFAVAHNILIPVSDRMWHDTYEDQTYGTAGTIWFGAVQRDSNRHEALLASYNMTGMIVNCISTRMYSFHAHDGYDANDCPPVRGVYRTSRLKLFEDRLGSKPKFHLLETSLMRYRHNVYSEAGEDGIITYLLETLGIEDGVCFEFGAWDGMFASNCRLLIERGWGGIMVEADSDKFKDLRANYRNHPQVSLVNAMVVPYGSNSIQELVKSYSPNGEVDVLSIDVDGLDYDLLSTLEDSPSVRPAIIIAECNGFVRPDLKAILGKELAQMNMQQSLYTFREKGKHLGYELVCFTQNAIFLRNDLASRLHVIQGADGRHPTGGGARKALNEVTRSVNRLYFEALLLNWNDLIRNIDLTRAGAPAMLVDAEVAEFGSYEASIDLEEILARAEAEEAELRGGAE